MRFYRQPNLFDPPYVFTPKVPKFHEIIYMEPKAHKETKFNRRAIAMTDPDKRAYMIALANELRTFSGWFKGIKFIHMKLLLVFERPDSTKPDHFNRSEWQNEELELMKCSSPDMDNCEKSIQDCLSFHRIQRELISKRTYRILKPEILGSGVIDDDRYIVSKSCAKVYARAGEEPRIEITLWERSNRYSREKKETAQLTEKSIQPPMKVTQAYVLYNPSNFKDECNAPYVIGLPEHGALGDKFNMGPSLSGHPFPKEATQRFKKRKDAKLAVEKFIHYAKEKIKDAHKGGKGKSRPSYYHWE